MKRFFHSELEHVRSDLILMGRKSVEMCQLAIRALLEGDNALVDQVLAADDDIDELNKTIDQEAIRYIALRAPVASDVRLLTVAMKCARELERVSDEAVTIAKRAREVNNLGGFPDFCQIPREAELCIELLNQALDIFTEENAEKARDLPQKDKEIDRLYRESYEKLTAFILSNREASERAVSLMFIAKALERIGDHASNIGVETYYMLAGVDLRHTQVKEPS